MFTKKKHSCRSSLLRKVTLKLSGCSSSCSCRKPNTIISDVFNPKPRRTKTTTYNNNYYSSAASSKTTTFSHSESSTTTPGGAAAAAAYYNSSDTESSDMKRSLSGGNFGRVGEESVAIEKDSNDPYLDFRRSMLQMILENEIYSKDDLKQLLNCFLQLNSPEYHGIIVRAFSEIWNGVF